MKCQRLNPDAKLSNGWHRLWCAECRAAHDVDAVIARGIAQMQAEPVPPEGLARTLAAVGLRKVEAAQPASATRRRYAPVATRRTALVAGALIVALVLFGAFLNGGRQGVDAVLAQTMEAMSKVRTVHFVEKKIIDGVAREREEWFKFPDKQRSEEKGRLISINNRRRTLSIITDRSPNVAVIGSAIGIGFHADWLTETGLQQAINNSDGQVIRKITRESTAQEQDGKSFLLIELQINDLNHESNEFARLWIDRDSHLVVAWEDWEVRKRDGKVTWRTVVERVDYNVDLPDSLFSMDIPKGAEVRDFSTPEGMKAWYEHRLRELDDLSPEDRMRLVDEWKHGDSYFVLLENLDHLDPSYRETVREKLRQYGISK